MNDRQRLEAIIEVLGQYLPPDGPLTEHEAMNEIIGLVDPLPPPAQPAPGMFTAEEMEAAKRAAYQAGAEKMCAETRKLVRAAEKAASGDSFPVYATAYDALQQHINSHAPTPVPKPVKKVHNVPQSGSS